MNLLPKNKKGPTLSLSKGFTLIELLVVIAIIGVLSSIVLTTLRNSRSKAADSKVKQQLVGFRRAAEIYYSNQNPNGYGATTASCAGAGSVFMSQLATDGNPWSYLNTWTGIQTPTSIHCQTNGSQYAVKASLSTGGGWCVDSTNASRAINAAQLAAGPALSCP